MICPFWGTYTHISRLFSDFHDDIEKKIHDIILFLKFHDFSMIQIEKSRSMTFPDLSEPCN